MLRFCDRTYRDRKEKYTRSLEIELAKCRRNETDLMAKVQSLKQHVQTLTTLLSQCGIVVPADNDEAQQQIRTGQQKSISTFTHLKKVNPTKGGMKSGFPASMHSNKDFLPNVSYNNRDFDNTTKLQTVQRRSDYTLPSEKAPEVSIGLNNINSSTHSTRLCELDSATLGMEFVLKYVLISYRSKGFQSILRLPTHIA